MIDDLEIEYHEPLFDPMRHCDLDAATWSSEVAAGARADVVADFVAARQPDACWPTHPFEAHDRAPRWCQHSGAAGAVSALRILRAAGIDAPDLTDSLGRIHAAWLAATDEGREPGLQLGEVGILAPWVAGGDAPRSARDRLERCMRDTIGHPAHEITSGEAGMMHAALTLFEATGDERWAAHYVAGAHACFEAWQRRTERNLWLWRNEIFGSVRHYFGACHGVAGNAGALLRGAALLPPEWVETTLERAAETLEAGAIREGEDVSWPVSPDPSGTRRLVQWCHGAAGVVVALADAPRTGSAASGTLDALLLAAGELTWRAGPVAKGTGTCHGTAGNGYAFLALHRRTGDAKWLERARTFAMHGVRQRERAIARHGQGKYTLWTGDGGFAVYLHHCLVAGDPAERTPFPGLEAL